MGIMDYLPQFGDNAPQDLSGIPADDAMVQLQLKRKLAMADALRNQEAPQGQMVSGHYVAPSWTQQLAGLANKYVAGQQEQNAMKQYGQAQQAKQAKLADLLAGKPTEAPMDYNEAGNMPGMMQTTRTPYNQQEFMAKAIGVMPELAPQLIQSQIAQYGKEDTPIVAGPGSIGFNKKGEKLFEVPNKPEKPTAPTVRSMRVGNMDVTQQWDPEKNSWTEVARGNAFKPNGDGQGNAPSGYTWTKNGGLAFIPGGPADPQLKEHTPLGSRESVFIGRIGTAANETARDLENIVKLPLTADRGFFGGRTQGGSLFSAGKESLTNKMTTQEVQSYNVLASGLQRNLAAIEAAGLAPSGTLTHQMDAVIFKDGDTNFSKLQKLAQIKQISNAGLETAMSNPRLPQKQIDHFQAIADKINKAVPYDVADTLALQNAHQTDPNMTINDVIKSKKVSQSETSQANLSNPKNLPLTNKKGWPLHYDAKLNAAYVGPKGEIEEVK